jgi:predicted transcriptional regulator
MILGGFALLLFAGAIGGLWLSLIGWFVLVAARAETAYGVAHDALSGLHVRDATVLDPVTVQAEITLARFLDDVFADTRYASYPVVDSGEITGLLAVGDVIDLPWEEAHRLTVREKTVGLDQVVLLEDDMDLAEAAAELLGSSLGRGLVTHEQQVVGLISLSDIERMLERRSIRPALGSRPHVSAGST